MKGKNYFFKILIIHLISFEFNCLLTAGDSKNENLKDVLPCDPVMYGHETDIKDIPYVALIKTDLNVCTGTIISNDKILTSAYCFHELDGGGVDVYVGANSGTQANQRLIIKNVWRASESQDEDFPVHIYGNLVVIEVKDLVLVPGLVEIKPLETVLSWGEGPKECIAAAYRYSCETDYGDTDENEFVEEFGEEVNKENVTEQQDEKEGEEKEIKEVEDDDKGAGENAGGDSEENEEESGETGEEENPEEEEEEEKPEEEESKEKEDEKPKDEARKAKVKTRRTNKLKKKKAQLKGDLLRRRRKRGDDDDVDADKNDEEEDDVETSSLDDDTGENEESSTQMKLNESVEEAEIKIELGKQSPKLQLKLYSLSVSAQYGNEFCKCPSEEEEDREVDKWTDTEEVEDESKDDEEEVDEDVEQGEGEKEEETEGGEDETTSEGEEADEAENVSEKGDEEKKEESRRKAVRSNRKKTKKKRDKRTIKETQEMNTVKRRKEVKERQWPHKNEITSNIICINNEGSPTCFSRIGGPLVCDGILMGIGVSVVDCDYDDYENEYYDEGDMESEKRADEGTSFPDDEEYAEYTNLREVTEKKTNTDESTEKEEDAERSAINEKVDKQMKNNNRIIEESKNRRKPQTTTFGPHKGIPTNRPKYRGGNIKKLNKTLTTSHPHKQRIAGRKGLRSFIQMFCYGEKFLDVFTFIGDFKNWLDIEENMPGGKRLAGGNTPIEIKADVNLRGEASINNNNVMLMLMLMLMLTRCYTA